MSNPEQSFGEGPLPPGVLPPELAAFLKGQDYACVTEATDHGTVLIIKVPNADIVSVRGPVPVLLHQALYQHPAAPVIRLMVNIFDQPASPLALETFINVADPHQLTKVAPYRRQQESAPILSVAERISATVPQEGFNFDVAKAAVMQASRL